VNRPDLVSRIEQIVSEVIHLGPAAQVAHIDQLQRSWPGARICEAIRTTRNAGSPDALRE